MSKMSRFSNVTSLQAEKNFLCPFFCFSKYLFCVEFYRGTKVEIGVTRLFTRILPKGLRFKKFWVWLVNKGFEISGSAYFQVYFQKTF